MEPIAHHPAPDLAWAVLGVRNFRARSDATLGSPMAVGHTWQPGVNEARCFLHPYPEHRAPKRRCGCGFNAWHPDDIPYWSLLDVAGAIAAWGEIDVYANGFRASHARVLMLIDDADRADHRLPPIADRYGLPIVTRDEVVEVAARSGVHPVPNALRPAKRPPSPTLARRIPRLDRLAPSWSCVWPYHHIAGQVAGPDVLALRVSEHVLDRLCSIRLWTPEEAPWVHRGDMLATARIRTARINGSDSFAVLRSPLSGKLASGLVPRSGDGFLAYIRPSLWHRDAASATIGRRQLDLYGKWAAALDDWDLAAALS